MKTKVKIYKIIRQTAGGFHSWVESSVGIIRKPNSAISLFVDSPKLVDLPALPKVIKKKWYQIVWDWVIKILPPTKF